MTSINSIKNQLSKAKDGFITLSKIPSRKAHIQFSGKLDNNEIIWDATIQTQASYQTELLADTDKSKRLKYLKSFIEIEAPKGQIAKLTVVLLVPIIDEPTIKKTMVMIRCYKNLKIGRHEFGKNF